MHLTQQYSSKEFKKRMIKLDQEESMKRILDSSAYDVNRSGHSSNTADVEVIKGTKIPSIRFHLIEKTENDVNPLLVWLRLEIDSINYWNWSFKCMHTRMWQNRYHRNVMLRLVKIRNRLDPLILRVDHFSSAIAVATSVIDITKSFERTTVDRRKSTETLRVFVEASRKTRPLVNVSFEVIPKRNITKALT